MLSQYRLTSFQRRDTKFERFLAKKQQSQRKLLNLENWCSGEVSIVPKFDFQRQFPMSPRLKVNPELLANGLFFNLLL